MATRQQNGNYNRTWSNPDQMLSNVLACIGEGNNLGLTSTRGRDGKETFNFQFEGNLPNTVGNIKVEPHQAVATKGRDFEDKDGKTNARHYGAITGVAGVNMQGQGTLQNMLPAVVVPDRKSDARQRAAVNDSFAALMGKIKETPIMEVNPARVHVFDSKELNEYGAPQRRFLIIEASGVFGEAKGNKPFYWSLLQHPLASFQQDAVGEADNGAPRSSRTRRTRESSSGETNAVGSEMATAATS